MLDTLQAKSGTLYSGKAEYSPAQLLSCDFGDTVPAKITKKDWEEETFESAVYSPAILLDRFHRQRAKRTMSENSSSWMYTLTISKTVVTVSISKSDTLVHSVRMLSAHDLYGDVTAEFHYSDFQHVGGFDVPRHIEISRTNGKRKDVVTISAVDRQEVAPKPFADSVKFNFAPEPANSKPEIVTTQYSDHIYFLDTKQADSRSLVVKFPSFILVAEAPLTSENGEAVLRAAQNIAPGMPIRYFVFGHHHPWYLGGVRPFVHRGVTVLSTALDTAYIRYLANAPRTLEPDSLQLDPKPVRFEVLNDSMTISDGDYRMKLYVIGNKSHHTEDYTIYYFPKEEMLFEDDLCWLPLASKPAKASIRQAGLYNAVKELGLVTKTVVQSWPLQEYGVRSTFPFADLEATIDLK
jgi:hypothetical protein